MESSAQSNNTTAETIEQTSAVLTNDPLLDGLTVEQKKAIQDLIDVQVKQRLEQFKQEEESKKTTQPSTKNIATKIKPPGTPSANKGKDLGKAAGTFGVASVNPAPKSQRPPTAVGQKPPAKRSDSKESSKSSKEENKGGSSGAAAEIALKKKQIAEEAKAKKEEGERKKKEEADKKKEELEKKKLDDQEKKKEEEKKRKEESDHKKEEQDKRRAEDAEKKKAEIEKKKQEEADKRAKIQQEKEAKEAKAAAAKQASLKEEEKKALIPNVKPSGAKPEEKKVKKLVENAEEEDPIAKAVKQRESVGGITAVVGERKNTTQIPRPQTAKVDKLQPIEEKKIAKKPADNDDDDPIAKSLKQREAAGGLTAVVGGPKKNRPETAVQKPEEKKKPQNQAPVAKPEEKKVVPPKTPNATGGKRPLIPSNDDISDDPIAQSLQQRMKAGGLTSVVTKAPNVNKTKPADKPNDKPADNTKIVLKPEKKTEPNGKEEVKKPAFVQSKKPESVPESNTTDKKPATAPTAKITQSKPQNGKPATEEKKEPNKTLVPAKTTSTKDEPQKKAEKSSSVSGQTAPKTLKGKKKNEEVGEDVPSEKPVEEQKEIFIPEPSSQIQNQDDKQLLEEESPPSFQNEILQNAAEDVKEPIQIKEHQLTSSLEVNQVRQQEDQEPHHQEIIIDEVQKSHNDKAAEEEQPAFEEKIIEDEEKSVHEEEQPFQDEDEEPMVEEEAANVNHEEEAEEDHNQEEELVSLEEEKPVEMDDIVSNDGEGNEKEEHFDNNLKDELAELENDDAGDALIINEEEDQLGELEDVPSYMLQNDKQAQEEMPEAKEEIVHEEGKEMSNGHIEEVKNSYEIDIEKLKSEFREVQTVISGVEIPDTFDSKNAGILIKELHDRVIRELLQNEELIDTLRSEQTPDIEKSLAGIQDSFKVSRTTKTTCLDFLADMDVDISNWISEANESELVKKVLRVWFSLVKPYNELEWTNYPQILYEDIFYPQAKMSLLNDAMMLGPFINKSIENLDLSEENLFKVSLLLKALFEDPQEELDPNTYEGSDNSAEVNMAFFLAIIKDVLEHTGLAADKQNKNVAKTKARDLKIALTKFEKLTKFTQYLTKVQGQIDQ